MTAAAAVSLANRYPVTIIGAGPAGLATSRELARRGIEHMVLERGDQVGTSWRNLYASLTLTTGKHLSALPGLPHDAAAPLYLGRADVVRYLERYARQFGLPVLTRCNVLRAERQRGDWRLRTTLGPIDSRLLVLATGMLSNPRKPSLPGASRYLGQIMHSVDYQCAAPFRGQRVLMVGAGNSAGDIALDLSRAGVDVTLSVRSGATIVPRDLHGIPVQYLAWAGQWLPRFAQRVIGSALSTVPRDRDGRPLLPSGRNPVDAIPLIGIALVDAIRSRTIAVRGAIESLTERGARFSSGCTEPFDAIILATGFDAAASCLTGQVSLDSHGNVTRRNRVCSSEVPGLFVIGQRYELPGALYNIAQDAPHAASLIADALHR